MEGGQINESGQNEEGEFIDPNPWHEGLTDKQRRFVEEYCKDFNATQAAIRAGYSASTANEQGSRLLANVSIRAAKNRLMDVLSMSTEEAIHRLTFIGRGSIEPFIESYGRGFKLDLSSEIAKEHYYLIKEIGYTQNGPYIKLHDAKDALVKILQMQGKLIDKKELTGKDGGPIAHTVAITPEDVKAFKDEFNKNY